MAPLTDPQREQVMEHYGHARCKAAEFVRPRRLPFDPYFSAALLGLIRAVRDWNPGRSNGKPFRYFAAAHIRGAMQDELRSYRPKGYRRIPADRRPLIDSLADRDPDGIEYAERVLSHDLPVGWEIESEDTVRTLVRFAPGQRGAILLAVCLNCEFGGGPVGYARATGKSANGVSSHMTLARNQIRESLTRGTDADRN